jgi:acetoin utilization deacetylase AcuC-like enzyme
MLMIHDPRCADYGSPSHPEEPTRVTHAEEHLRTKFPGWTWKTPRKAVPDETLLLAHTQAHLARLEVPRDFDPDTAYFPGIGSHARRSVAAALDAADHARANGQPAFSLMRPPGHHATAHYAMGFCYLNQIAIAALAASREAGAGKVAVWDFDAHHGNGTEDILHGRKEFLYCSVHQSPCYPGTGLGDSGNCRNWPILPQTPRGRHLEALRASLDAIVSFDPDLVLVSAGFDAYAGDPLTEMTLEPEDFSTLGLWLRQTGLPAAAALEGGYSADLPILIEAFLTGWSAESAQSAKG